MRATRAPQEGAGGRPEFARRRAGRSGQARRGDQPQRARHQNRHQGGADCASGHRDVERGDGVRGRLEQPFGRQDRRDRQPQMKQQRRDAIADVEQAPVRMARGQQSPAQGVADDDDPKSVEQRVEPALQSRIGNIEQVERVSEGFQREQRQNGEHQDRPGGGERRGATDWASPHRDRARLPAARSIAAAPTPPRSPAPPRAGRAPAPP